MQDKRSQPKRKPLVITPGDPAGIGLDIAVTLQSSGVSQRIVVITDRNVLAERARALGQKISICDFGASSHFEAAIEVLHIECGYPVSPGVPDPRHSRFILNAIERAVQGCVEDVFSALITGPVNKETIRKSGIDFTGHTEFLAELTQSQCPVMLLTNGRLRVALVTNHLPLADVSTAVTKDKILLVARVLNAELKKRFHIQSPRIGICGLNPHAGEGGTLGCEEITDIIPAIQTLRDENIDAAGPFAADTIFTPNQLDKFDVTLAMYHDQGLPVIKHSDFGQVVNVTLGLPIIRTSVDHGTAYDVAGTGQADNSSMLSAIALAQKLRGR